jgi:hypothetical protein
MCFSTEQMTCAAVVDVLDTPVEDKTWVVIDIVGGRKRG